MQIELVGCTSAGKSTLAAQLTDADCAEGIDLQLADEFALDQLGLGHLRKKWLRAVVVHIVALWGCLSSGWRHAQFVKFAYRELRHSKISRSQQWNQLRKVLKQLGRYEVIRCARQGQTPVLVDEGTLHAAHNLFVHADFEFDDDHVRQFAEQVPLPDLVIYVRQSEDVLVERALHRGHPRISQPTRESVAAFVHQAVEAFEHLSNHERIAPRMLVVQNGMILSEPAHLAAPHMWRTLELLRGAIESGTLPTNHLARESTPAAHTAAV